MSANWDDVLEQLECGAEIVRESRAFRGDWIGAETTLAYVIIFKETAIGAGDPSIMAIAAAWSIFPRLLVLPSQNEFPVLLMLNEVTVEGQSYLRYKLVGKYVFNSNEGFSGQQGIPEGSEAEVLPQIRLNFNIGGGTRRITKGIEVLSAVARTDFEPGNGVPPDLKGAIGASQDGISGYEIPDNMLSIQVTAYYKPKKVNYTFIRQLKSLCGKTNAGGFLGQAAGEVLFVGASGGGTVLDIIPITFEFLIAENIDDEPDEGFPNITAKGHDVVDYLYLRQSKPGAGDIILMEPTYRYIHKVVYSGNFTIFGFGR